MLKNVFFLLIFLVGTGLYSDTVMIETIGDVPQGNRAYDQKELLIGMETGVMDILFDGGHLFFNQNSSSGGLTEENTQKSLMLAKKGGAQWLLRLIPGEESVRFITYDLSNFQIKGEGEISREDVSATFDFKEFYFEAGKTAGNAMVALITNS